MSKAEETLFGSYVNMARSANVDWLNFSPIWIFIWSQREEAIYDFYEEFQWLSLIKATKDITMERPGSSGNKGESLYSNNARSLHTEKTEQGNSIVANRCRGTLSTYRRYISAFDICVVLWNPEIAYDVTDVEFPKTGSVGNKTTLDHMKPVVEVKCAFDPLVKEYDLSVEEVKRIKGMFVTVTMKSPDCYVHFFKI
ncbi:hypothetical protein BJV82DRAFT_578291 [Fennellomyces sp. T-0311]|nr:hypothetical protein BJV82DRAFT_578291 [Fennellomyces sp. T-0311]